MRILLILTFLLISACGADDYLMPAKYHKKYEVGEFAKYVEMFKKDAKTYGDHDLVIDDLIVKFKDIENDPEKTSVTLGRCTLATGQTPIITIDPDLWDNRNESHRMLLMYHELGHCILQRGHEEEADSIMNPYILRWKIFEDDKDYYLTELFDETEFNTFWKLYIHIDNDICAGEDHVNDHMDNSNDSYNHTNHSDF